MSIFVRDFHPGMGTAVAERTILRKKPDGTWESWGDVAHRVAVGNSMLCPDSVSVYAEYDRLHRHLAKATVLMSGRHLQHGDETQIQRPMEVFTNCLDGDTLVLSMEYGAVPLAQVADQTVTVIAGDGVPRPAKINAHGVQPVQRIVFRANEGGGGNFRHEVIATANHRWPLRTGEITESLSEGDVIAANPVNVSPDAQAVIHGLVFGDGSAHKGRRDSYRPGVSQGRTYATIRVCKQDAVQEEICAWLDDAGYRFTTPPHAKGDPVYYVGKLAHAKELPYTNDPEYIAGFIHGWWLADGSKGVTHAMEISTADTDAAQWLLTHAALAGFSPTMHRVMPRTVGDGSFPNGKPLHVIRLRKGVEWKVESIEPLGERPVFCPEEPVTSQFLLANGMPTGNCSTSANTFTLFLLLLNGSGVGRCYDDDMMLVNWDYAPNVRCVLDTSHPDFDWSAHESVRDAKHKYGSGKDVLWHVVDDSREGWAKAVELWENAAFEKVHKDKLLILDFTKVRPKGAPIGGMQNRPSSGPVPLMNAFAKAASIKGAGLEPWRQTMYIDHYFAECVLVGGARRSARMSTKSWRDPSVVDFIYVKRPVEFDGLSMAEVVELRRSLPHAPQSFLWSSNNSVTVDAEFWALLDEEPTRSPLAAHAHRVWKAVTTASYGDGTGEPGLINVDKLVRNDEGWSGMEDGAYIGSKKYQVNEDTRLYLSKLAKRAKKKPQNMITNPCGEIALILLGGYCVIADVVPFHADTLDEAEDAFRTTTRALMRVNLMDCLYRRETRRTNRIGVGMTGVHEFAWKFFKVGFRDLISPDFAALGRMGEAPFSVDDAAPAVRSAMFWLTLSRFSRAVREEAVNYANELGVEVPHTMLTIKPAGTTSKLFGLTEGWHLPSMREYLRYVQFREDDPLVEEYRAKGYPTRTLTSYRGTVIVGFPTQPTICSLGMGDNLVTAGEATPEEQYRWLMLGERYWLQAAGADGIPLPDDRGNQISYTLKYVPELVSFTEFGDMMRRYQSQIRACSVMPQEDGSSYEYTPETSITKAEYEKLSAAIRGGMAEDIGKEHIVCDNGVCPVDFRAGEKAELAA